MKTIKIESLKDALKEFAPPSDGAGLKGIDALPPACFAKLPSSGEVIRIDKGESGYSQYKHNTTDEKMYPSDEEVAAMNAEMGVSPEAADAMMAGSMFGWHVSAVTDFTESIAKAIDFLVSENADTDKTQEIKDLKTAIANHKEQRAADTKAGRQGDADIQSNRISHLQGLLAKLQTKAEALVPPLEKAYRLVDAEYEQLAGMTKEHLATYLMDNIYELTAEEAEQVADMATGEEDVVGGMSGFGGDTGVDADYLPPDAFDTDEATDVEAMIDAELKEGK